MKAAGLTHGGFYKHFESKDQLVTEACAEAVGKIIEYMATARGRGTPKLWKLTSRPVTGTIQRVVARCPRSAASLAGATKGRGRWRRKAS